MSGWGAFASGMAQLGSDLMGMQNAHDARQWQEHAARYQHTWAAEDLERAGLNRVLALGNPSSAGSAPMPPPMGNPVQAYYSAKQAQEAIETADAQQDLLRAEADTQAATAADIRTNTMDKIVMQPFNKDLSATQSDTNRSTMELNKARALLESLEGDKQEVLKSLYQQFGPLVTEGVRYLRERFTSAKDADIVDKVQSIFGSGRGRMLSDADYENLAQAFIVRVERGDAQRSEVFKFNPDMRKKVFELRPEWKEN